MALDRLTQVTTSGISTTASPSMTDLVLSGVATVSSAVVGSAVTITSGGLNVSGVVTATSFVGDGSGIT